MPLAEFFPMWDQLTPEDRAALTRAAVSRSVPAGTLLSAGEDCLGLVLVRAGQLRAFHLSPEGREITLYRLFARDICLFSASCLMRGIRLNLSIQAEKDSLLWMLPAAAFQPVQARSAPLAGFVNQIMAERFAEVMEKMEQVLWDSMDRRLAAFLLEESALEGADELTLTHERIARHLGTAREVVTRLLRQFQGEGLVRLSRGTVALTDRAGLRARAQGRAPRP